MTDATAERLTRFVSDKLGRPVRLVDLERGTEGFSQETFLFTIDDGGTHRGYVAKREPVAGLLEPYDLEPEFRVLHTLSADAFPSPPTPWFERDPAVFDRTFYVMERLTGDVPVPSPGPEFMGPFTEAERGALGPDVARTLAALHAIDWRGRGMDFLGIPGRDAAARELARWEDRIARAALPTEPALADALVWLRAHVPVVDEITLVHGDFRVGNFLVARDGSASRITGLLDWEMVHLGDPLEDVAWCVSPLWRAGTPMASGLMLPEEFFAAYTAASGRAVDLERVRFWEVLALVKMIAIMLTGIRAFRDGRTDDLRMAIFDHQLPFLLMLLGTYRGWLGG